MPQTLEGQPRGADVRVALVVSRFNETITSRLLEGAEECLDGHGCPADQRLVARVPGAWELPQAARLLGTAGGFDAVIALGALVRGETPHFDYIAQAVAQGLTRVGLDTGVPVIFGVLTTDNVQQALDRSGPRGSNKGWQAALAALEMADLFRQLGGKRR